MVRVFGIRHHGPGSARSVAAALATMKPDAVLIEGPSDVGDVLKLAGDVGMKPPVSLLAYDQDDPSSCVFYPFAEFSPEWQAITWALKAKSELRFIDLPAKEVLSQMAAERAALAAGPSQSVVAIEEQPVTDEALRMDPLGMLAHAAGYSDTEGWWEDMVEHQGSTAAFDAIEEAMTELRLQIGAQMETEHEQRREAHMHAQVKKAMDEGYQNIAVICGAWHAPIFADMNTPRSAPAGPRAKGKVTLTWVPWTYSRLASGSGYGAGVTSPGWYEHLFHTPDQPLIKWLSRVGDLLRSQDTDISTAHIIEVARTANSLAALRGRPMPGLPEITQSLESVLGDNSDAMLSLLTNKLIIGEKLGEIASGVPMVPLARDIEKLQKSLRLKPAAMPAVMELDLRRDLDLRRSHFLHRLHILGIEWGTPHKTTGKGTFKEGWEMQWQPEFSVKIVEAAAMGTTVLSAASGKVNSSAQDAEELSTLTSLLEQSLLADLPDAVENVLAIFESKAAVSNDILGLMDAVPPLARAARYGSVRATDTSVVESIVSELTLRVCVGMPGACASIDDESAASIMKSVVAVNGALGMLDDETLTDAWLESLTQAADRSDVHSLLRGRAVRLLRDHGHIESDDVAVRMQLALSVGTPPLEAAGWLEGFLTGSGAALIHDQSLLVPIDEWLSQADPDSFTNVLPALRRTFTSFEQAERRQIGERLRSTAGTVKDEPVAVSVAAENINSERAALVMPIARILFGAK